MRRARIVSVLFAILLAASAFGRQLPNINKFGEQAPSPANAAALAAKAQALGKNVRLSGEPRLGVPTFVWATRAMSVIPASFKAVNSATPTQAEAAARA